MIRAIYIAILLFLPALASGQLTYTFKAYKAYQEDDLPAAKAYIDSAIVDDTEKEEAQTWYIRGFIYKEIYKITDKQSRDSEAREEAIRSFKKSIELDADSEFRKQNRQGIKYLASSYYNDGVMTLNPKEYEESADFYKRYKELILFLEPEKDFKEQDIEYYNALGSMLNQNYEKDKDRYEHLFSEAEKSFSRTLKMNPDNLLANNALGVMYYNKGVDLILSLDPFAPLEDLNRTQDKCVKIFKTAKPFLEKAHQMDPTNCEIITGLEGISFNLNDRDEVKFWHDKLVELGCAVDE